jgi:hypothetical protein
MSGSNDGMVEQNVRNLARAFDDLNQVRERWRKIESACADPANRRGQGVSAILDGAVNLGPIWIPIAALDATRAKEIKEAEDRVRELGGRP